MYLIETGFSGLTWPCGDNQNEQNNSNKLAGMYLQSTARIRGTLHDTWNDTKLKH